MWRLTRMTLSHHVPLDWASGITLAALVLGSSGVHCGVAACVPSAGSALGQEASTSERKPHTNRSAVDWLASLVATELPSPKPGRIRTFEVRTEIFPGTPRLLECEWDVLEASEGKRGSRILEGYLSVSDTGRAQIVTFKGPLSNRDRLAKLRRHHAVAGAATAAEVEATVSESGGRFGPSAMDAIRDRVHQLTPLLEAITGRELDEPSVDFPLECSETGDCFVWRVQFLGRVTEKPETPAADNAGVRRAPVLVEFEPFDGRIITIYSW